MAKRILVVDDEPSILASLDAVLRDEGYAVDTVATGAEALSRIQRNRFDAVLLDVWLPDLEGIEVLRQLRSIDPDLGVIVMSGHGTIETAVRATKLGAFDFLEKPLSLERVLIVLQNVLHTRSLEHGTRGLRAERPELRPLLGESPSILKIRGLIDQVAPTNSSVLITGENGTGKELIARHLHALSTRAAQAFIETNCAAIPEELIESELFGHERGSFTGAIQARKGKFELADGGTIFLDEIGDMSLRTQSKLLRVLQERRFERVGGQLTLSVDVRVLAATNKDLKREIEAGRFREDLFYRLNVIPIHLAPLRERAEDIGLLANTFLEEFSREHARLPRKLSSGAIVYLKAYPWPGNVRELRNTLERLVILSRDSSDISGEEIRALLGSPTVEPPDEKDSSQSLKSLRDARAVFERDWILKILAEQDGNVAKAAAVLGIERTHLYRKLKSFGISGGRD